MLASCLVVTLRLSVMFFLLQEFVQICNRIVVVPFGSSAMFHKSPHIGTCIRCVSLQHRSVFIVAPFPWFPPLMGMAKLAAGRRMNSRCFIVAGCR